ncbi:PAS domain-containing protein [Kribbella qitaiheensis]|uniref:PAS domain-containing protein n=1 Tax=Kribbella qitaiheensis TaxID=1544730 RepID=A0A7G6X342_9ACTN|nr:substrate-binding domain-containing protein [Kribbella qitaiheensis]QNE20657.1 PAS domain-containing protein [Kribbella qitaiheensis]
MDGMRRGAMVTSARRTIGVLSPVVGGFYFGALIAGVSRAARRDGHSVVAVQTYPAGLDRERYPDEPLLEVPVALDAVDGIIVIAKAVRHDRLASMQEWGRPVVLISEDQTTLPAPVVVPDNAGGVSAALQHLVEHGHTRIGFIGSPLQRDIRERYDAYRTALAEHGIKPGPGWFSETADNHEQGGSQAAARLLAGGMPTTATIAATDRNAVGFIRALQAAGLVLPRDQAIIGFDRTETGARLVPRLSTVDPHNDRIGGLAVKLLLARLRGEEVAAGVYRAPSTLVIRESCGCGESTAQPDTDTADPLFERYGSTPARACLRRLSDSGFGGRSAAPGSSGTGDDEARAGWLRAVVDPITTAAERGTVPSGVSLGRLADLTSVRRPYPEALEQFVAAVRDLETELTSTLPPGSDQVPTLRRVTTDILLALTKGCTRPMLARSGYLERTIAEQYEVDLDLLRGRGSSPRALTWLPSARRSAACLGLWAGHERSPGDREVEIVGVNDTTGTLSRLIGTRTPASQFPPAALTRAGGSGSSGLTLVLPVTFGGSDWGLLAIDGTVDIRMTSGRDKYNHWAALLAVALDQERLMSSLRDQRLALEEAAARERALADTIRASEERYALASMAAQDGTWDWDVSAGTVYYSPRWKQTLGYGEEQIGSSLTEWLDRVHPDDRNELSAAIAAQLGGARTPLELEHRVRTSSGDYRWMMCRAVTVLDDAGCPARLVGALVDMTERKEHELALRRNALRDPETGLVNRILFLDRLGAAIKRTRRSSDYDCAVVLLRVVAAPDDLPVHDDPVAAEVEVRREVVGRLRQVLAEGDSAARLRQDEFAVLLDDIGPDGIRIDELVASVQPNPNAGIAVGVLPTIKPFQDADEALRGADIALLRAQTQPRAH